MSYFLFYVSSRDMISSCPHRQNIQETEPTSDAHMKFLTDLPLTEQALLPLQPESHLQPQEEYHSPTAIQSLPLHIYNINSNINSNRILVNSKSLTRHITIILQHRIYRYNSSSNTRRSLIIIITKCESSRASLVVVMGTLPKWKCLNFVIFQLMYVACSKNDRLSSIGIEHARKDRMA